MLSINFHPECDIPRFTEAAEEYKKIWAEDGERITKTIQEISGYNFRAETYNAIILDNKPSASYPLILLANYSPEKKKSTLVHELTHKVIPRNEVMKASELENHKILNLVLYNIWTELYGKEFADNSVAGEFVWGDTYKKAWEYALALTKEQRLEEYQKFLSTIK
jgi:hypothetical protein